MGTLLYQNYTDEFAQWAEYQWDQIHKIVP